MKNRKDICQNSTNIAIGVCIKIKFCQPKTADLTSFRESMRKPLSQGDFRCMLPKEGDFFFPALWRIVQSGTPTGCAEATFKDLQRNLKNQNLVFYAMRLVLFEGHGPWFKQPLQRCLGPAVETIYSVEHMVGYFAPNFHYYRDAEGAER